MEFLIALILIGAWALVKHNVSKKTMQTSMLSYIVTWIDERVGVNVLLLFVLIFLILYALNSLVDYVYLMTR